VPVDKIGKRLIGEYREAFIGAIGKICLAIEIHGEIVTKL
jgi:hypothetical protein